MNYAPRIMVIGKSDMSALDLLLPSRASGQENYSKGQTESCPDEAIRRLLNENAALSEQISALNMALTVSEAALKYAQDYVEKQSQQMRIIHEGYTRAIRAKHFDALGHQRINKEETPEWEPN